MYASRHARHSRSGVLGLPWRWTLIKRSLLGRCFLVTFGLSCIVGCGTVRSASRKVLGLDSTAGDPDLDGDLFLGDVYTEGRFDRSDRDALAFSWSGSRIAARFSGTSAGVELEDVSGKNQFYVVVDGQVRKDK